MIRSNRFSKIVAVFLAVVMMFAVVAGCANGNGNGNSGNGNTPATPPKAEEPKKEEPAEIVKIRVSLWDRGNAPEGQKITDTMMTKWVNEQMKPLGVEVEYVPLPRSEESAKLNTWMAAGSAPDVVLTYNPDTFVKFASQGGLASLDASVEKYGQDILANNKVAMESAGVFDGVRYAVMARKANEGGPVMKIRADWLEKLGMNKPTNMDELYTVLKAFKEQDPGNVGKDKVIPYAIPSLDHNIHFGPSMGMGMDMAGPGTQIYMASGNVINGEFVSHVATPQGREYFKFLNQLYSEGLIPKEFITDVNGQQYKEDWTAGRVGFFENNDPAYKTDGLTKEVPGINWEIVPPFIAPDGEQQMTIGFPFGMFIMVPKTSEKKTDAVVKYLNWMSDEAVNTVLQNGFEGEHYNIVNGIRMPIDAAKNKADFSWYAGDLAIMSLGLPAYSSEVALVQYADKGEDFAQDVVEHRETLKKYGVYQPLLTNDRPWAAKNSTTMDAMLLQELSNVIISKSFDADYDKMLARWESMGGRTYDAEITEGLKILGKIK